MLLRWEQSQSGGKGGRVQWLMVFFCPSCCTTNKKSGWLGVSLSAGRLCYAHAKVPGQSVLVHSDANDHRRPAHARDERWVSTLTRTPFRIGIPPELCDTHLMTERTPPLCVQLTKTINVSGRSQIYSKAGLEIATLTIRLQQWVC